MERRKEQRVNGAAVRRITGRIRPGYAVVVINLSPSGALVEGARPLPPGRRVDVHLAEDDLRVLVRALVIRCSVAALDADSIRYRAGLVFEERMDVREPRPSSVDRVFEPETALIRTPWQSLPHVKTEPAERASQRREML